MSRERIQFTQRAAEKMLRATKIVLSQGTEATGPDAQRSRRVMFFEGELTSDCTKATNPKTGATTCTAKRYRPVAGSVTDPIAMELSPEPWDTFNLVNRSKSLQSPTGTYCIWIRIGKEFRIIWVDC